MLFSGRKYVILERSSWKLHSALSKNCVSIFIYFCINICFCIKQANKICTLLSSHLLALIAFSRNERTHPNLVSQASQAREKSRFFVDCKLAAPLGFCRGCGPRFRVHLSRHSCSLLWLPLLFSTFWGFL